MATRKKRKAGRAARKRRRFLRAIVVLAAVLIGVPVLARLHVHYSARGRVFTDVEKAPHCRVALVLGASVRADGRLSRLLGDRVNAAIELYRAGVVEKLLMSGDNRVTHYNEPRRMRDYAVRHGVPPADVAMDFAGRRTYDSVYRAKHIFGLDRLMIVSQGFHVERAIFLCDHIGVEGIGFASDVEGRRNVRVGIRELGACVGALVDVYLREPRPVMGKREKV